MTVQEWLGKDNEIGIDIWHKKYQQNNETFDDWIYRISGGDEDIARLIVEKKFLFGGRILSNRGLEKQGVKTTFSNCYVNSPPEDSIESIFQCASDIARTFSYGGGVGVDLSNLAPRGSIVNNAAKTTSGAVSFMDLFSLTSELIGQDGRRGALMLSLSCDHPDLEEFINVKSDLNKVTKANISVRMNNDFMTAAKEDKNYDLYFNRPETERYTLKLINAKEMLMKLAKMNWGMGEPGVLFWDRIEEYNLLNKFKDFKYSGINPCGEEPLPAGGSCLLGSINLAEFVKNGKFESEDFVHTIRTAVVGLNDVLEEGLDLHPLELQREVVRDYRQIGLGIMGLADMLVKLGIEYGGQQSITLCDTIGQIFAEEAILQSSVLAQIYGAFDKCENEKLIESSFFKAHPIGVVADTGLRNSQLLTIAPTGTISTMIGVSGGLEPIYDLSYTRKTESLHGEDKYYKIYTPIVEEYMIKNGIDNENELPSFFITSKTLDYHNRIKMQAIWQKHIDASISSTVNLPETATIDDVFNIYIEAWENGLKGITVFRDNCSRTGILTTITEPKERGKLKDTPVNAVGKKRKIMTGCGSLHILAFFDPNTGELLETYLNKGSTGGCNNFMIGLSRMLSLAARAGASVEDIVDQLKSTGACPSYAVRKATRGDVSIGSCCPMAIGNSLLEMYEEMQDELKTGVVTVQATQPVQIVQTTQHICPECGSPIAFESGCVICKSCGYSKCS